MVHALSCLAGLPSSNLMPNSPFTTFTGQKTARHLYFIMLLKYWLKYLEPFMSQKFSICFHRALYYLIFLDFISYPQTCSPPVRFLYNFTHALSFLWAYLCALPSIQKAFPLLSAYADSPYIQSLILPWICSHSHLFLLHTLSPL